MKKCFCLVLAALIFTASFCFDMSAFGAQSSIEKTRFGTSDTYYEYDAATQTLTISGSGAMPDLKNNESSIPWYDMRYDDVIKNVVVDEGITYIGNYALMDVKADSFTIPSTLKSIGKYSFASSSVSEIELPFGFTTVGNYAFDSCALLTHITFPDTLTSIGNYAFRFCSNLESLALPHSLNSVGSYAFDSCSSLGELIFDDMTANTKLLAYAFYDCAALGTVSFPSGVTLASKSFGIGRSGLLSGLKMRVYDSSSAHIYATANGVSYEIIDNGYPLSLGTANTVTYDENNVDKAYAFTYTPDFSGVYNFYSRGGCDVKAALYCGTELLCESDDLTDDDRNFCVTYELESGTEYTYKVTSMDSQGTTTLVIYPDEILSFDIDGSLSFDAADGFRSGGEAYFPIIDSLLSGFVLDIHFAGGYSKKMYYSAGYFNNTQIAVYDTQTETRFTCGENSETVKIGDVAATFPVYINHTYSKTVVPYTAYDDGYTLFRCMLCGDEYTGDYVESPAITVRGRILLATGTDTGYNSSYPLTESTVEFGGEEYAPDSSGWFTFKTLESGELVIKNPYCADTVLTVDNDYHNINFGAIGLPAYDFNGDGYINGRDLALFKIRYQSTLGKQYFKYAVNFM